MKTTFFKYFFNLENDELFSFGGNYFGGLGIGDSVDDESRTKNTPQLISFF